MSSRLLYTAHAGHVCPVVDDHGTPGAPLPLDEVRATLTRWRTRVEAFAADGSMNTEAAERIAEEIAGAIREAQQQAAAQAQLQHIGGN